MDNFECTLTAVDPWVIEFMASYYDLTLWIKETNGSYVVQVTGDEDDVAAFEEEVFQYECICIHNQ